jgi:hypothetical protein
MPSFAIVPLVFSLLLASVGQPAWSRPNGSGRAEELAVMFNKSKHKVKDKKGIHIDIKVDVTSELVPKPAAEYAGTYGAWDDLSLDVHLNGGQITVTGTEPDGDVIRSYTVSDAQLDGAMLTGTKVYADGGKEKFEGVFIKRTVHTNQSDRDETTFGLGVVFDPPKRTGADDGWDMNKIFYESKTQ